MNVFSRSLMMKYADKLTYSDKSLAQFPWSVDQISRPFFMACVFESKGRLHWRAMITPKIRLGITGNRVIKLEAHLLSLFIQPARLFCDLSTTCISRLYNATAPSCFRRCCTVLGK
ncbi:hypothetical protein PM082_024546 [Marasmius tenuissimus]|nr:hypothetical protein PM082_024546 [Marasmius tenuissimus]